MKKLFGQLLVPPALSVLALQLFFGDWWDSVGMRSRWSVWILLSAGLLLLFQFVWSAYERHRPHKPAPARPAPAKSTSKNNKPSPAPILIKKAPAPLKRVPTPPKPDAPEPSEQTAALSLLEERRVLAAARRTLTGECDRVELYHNQGRLFIREVRFKNDAL